MRDEPDTVMLAGTLFWIRRPYRPQPPGPDMLPECENPPDPAVTSSYVCGAASWRWRREKNPVKKTYNVLDLPRR